MALNAYSQLFVLVVKQRTLNHDNWTATRQQQANCVKYLFTVSLVSSIPLKSKVRVWQHTLTSRSLGGRSFHLQQTRQTSLSCFCWTSHRRPHPPSHLHRTSVASCTTGATRTKNWTCLGRRRICLLSCRGHYVEPAKDSQSVVVAMMAMFCLPPTFWKKHSSVNSSPKLMWITLAIYLPIQCLRVSG